MEEEFVEISPEVWKPTKKGDSITGILVSKQEGVGVNKSRMYGLKNKDGQWKVWGSTLLDDRMLHVQIGSKVRITFKEMTKNSKGQDLKIFKVESVKPGSALMGSGSNLAEGSEIKIDNPLGL